MQSRSLICLFASFAFLSGAALAQTQPPSAPTPQTPGAPAAAQGPTFPPVNQANFTAPSPTKAEVDAFLHATWGYDENRVWEVYGVEKTAAPGMSKVIVLVAEKPNPQTATFSFYVTPDGKHLIAQDQLLDFGAHPYDEIQHKLQERADGPSLGAKSRQFTLVEFADFECPHCKQAEPIARRLVTDFPQAHFVFENFPLVNIHPQAFRAAAYGQCIFQQGGSDAFFKYADSIFAGQEALSGQGADQALRNSVTAAGLDPDKIATCSDSAEAKNAVHASMRLGTDLNVDQTPWLFIDGRGLPMMEVPYEQLKKIIQWQFDQDKQAGSAAAGR